MPTQNDEPSLPVLDPSPVTTRQIIREIASLEKQLQQQIQAVESDASRSVVALEKQATQRMDAIEKAVAVAHDNLVRVPTEVDKSVGHLRDVHDEKFKTVQEQLKGLQTQLLERDTKSVQDLANSKVALDAALSAQEKQFAQQTASFAQSIAKSEAAASKQSDQQSQLLVTTAHGLSEKIDDIKDRLTRIEGEGRGLKQAETTQQTSNMSVVSIIGLVLGTLIGIAGIVTAVISASGP